MQSPHASPKLSPNPHLHRLVGVGGEVLGLQADEQATPQAHRHRHKQVPARRKRKDAAPRGQRVSPRVRLGLLYQQPCSTTHAKLPTCPPSCAAMTHGAAATAHEFLTTFACAPPLPSLPRPWCRPSPPCPALAAAHQLLTTLVSKGCAGSALGTCSENSAGSVPTATRYATCTHTRTHTAMRLCTRACAFGSLAFVLRDI